MYEESNYMYYWLRDTAKSQMEEANDFKDFLMTRKAKQ
jgi:hypothetical protein